MVDFYSKDRYGFADLRRLVQVLRAPDGCPWDRVQTHDSIRRNFIEEVYEACEAIDSGDTAGLMEELGDVLLHIVFHAGIEEDAGRFTIDDVCDGVVKKMISRHPAIFGTGAELDWDEIKRREKGQVSVYEELDAVARSLPALWRAEKMQKKAEKAGFDPRRFAAQGQTEEASVGALLFEAVCRARAMDIDPEEALNQHCDAFLAWVRREEAGRNA